MKENPRLERQKHANLAVGMATIDGGKPSTFTKKPLNQYERGQVSTNKLKKDIVKKYTGVSQ